ncbi:MAG: ATP synthase F1 subunit delta [Alphaproteobacteria bacterium]|nr:ATP synthase F1 subunit delta [Alphaproteobacteria bacterium]
MLNDARLFTSPLLSVLRVLFVSNTSFSGLSFSGKPLPVVATRYANALYMLADEQGQVTAVEKEVRNVQALLQSSAELARFVANPLLRRDVIVKGLDALFAKANISGLSQQFFHVVVKNGRAAAIAVVIQAFLNLAAEKRGEIVAQVTAAHALTDAQKEMIASALQQALSARGVKKIVIAATVDANVLGGMMVQIGSSLYDGTIKGKLMKLSQALKANKAA